MSKKSMGFAASSALSTTIYMVVARDNYEEETILGFFNSESDALRAKDYYFKNRSIIDYTEVCIREYITNEFIAHRNSQRDSDLFESEPKSKQKYYK